MADPVPTESDVYTRLGTLERETASHGAILHSHGAILESLREGQERLLKRAEQPTNWVGIGGLMFTVFTFLGSIMFILTDANRQALDVMRAELNERTPIVYSLPETVKSNTEARLTLTERVNRTVQEVSSLTSEVDKLTDQVDHIDNHGSRRWNRRDPSD